MIAESHWVNKYCRLRFSEDARSARTIMAHLERGRLKSLLWDMLWILYLQFSCTLYCQWHMHAHLSLFVSIYNVRFLNIALLRGRSWDTRYINSFSAGCIYICTRAPFPSPRDAYIYAQLTSLARPRLLSL